MSTDSQYPTAWAYEQACKALEDTKRERDNLRVQLAAAQEDAKRIDWMDEYEAEVQKYESQNGSKRYEVWFFVGTDPSPTFSAPDLRVAIDAARKASKTKEQRTKK